MKSAMPGWHAHYRFAKSLGFKIDGKVARKIDKALDKPTFAGKRLGHKAIHNDLGVRLARLAWGELGEEYAKAHLRLDRTPVSKRVIPPPSEKVVDIEDAKTTLQNLFKEMFHTMEEFSNLTIRKPSTFKQERKLQKKPKSGLGNAFCILLVLAAALSGFAN